MRPARCAPTLDTTSTRTNPRRTGDTPDEWAPAAQAGAAANTHTRSGTAAAIRVRLCPFMLAVRSCTGKPAPERDVAL